MIPFSLLTTLALCSCEPKPKPVPDTRIRVVAAEPDSFQPATYLGLPRDEATAIADKAGIRWRIVEVDGQPRPVTMDHLPDRLNFAIARGKVIRVTKG